MSAVYDANDWLPKKPYFTLMEAEYWLGRCKSYIYVLRRRGLLILVSHPYERGTAVTRDSMVLYMNSRGVPLGSQTRQRSRRPLPRLPGEVVGPVR